MAAGNFTYDVFSVVDDTYQQTVLSQVSADKELPDNPTVRVLKHLSTCMYWHFSYKFSQL